MCSTLQTFCSCTFSKMAVSRGMTNSLKNFGEMIDAVGSDICSTAAPEFRVLSMKSVMKRVQKSSRALTKSGSLNRERARCSTPASSPARVKGPTRATIWGLWTFLAISSMDSRYLRIRGLFCSSGMERRRTSSMVLMGCSKVEGKSKSGFLSGISRASTNTTP